MIKQIQAAKAALTLIGLLIALCTAYWQGKSHGLAKGEAELAGIKSLYSQGALLIEVEGSKRLAAEQKTANAAAATMQSKFTTLSALAAARHRSIYDVTKNYQPTPGAPLQPLPFTGFTLGAVRLYNNAITTSAIAMPETGHTTSAANQTDATATTETGLRDQAELSTVTQADLFAHHIDYGLYCQQLDAQLTALIEIVKGK
jgi:hypothetical protein